MKTYLKATASTSALFATLATATFLTPISTQKAHAQALPVVDVCTGISLPRSAVTEVIGAVNQPIVGEVEGVVNGITGLLGGVPLLSVLGFPTLNVDLTTILADAEAGDPLSLQVLNSDGNIVTDSDDCNIGADNFSLNDEGGISIGGNQISGLGTNGQAAIAGEQSAIAFGNNASTSIGADGAIAFGSGASATEGNAVAIGAGSVADRAALTGYSAAGITGTVDSAGAVSFGSAGQERQLINIAPGSAPNDAATVGQVTGAIAEATGNLIAYDDAALTSITLGGAGGTTVTNVADGALNASSSDAVNGSQLFATNQNVAANTSNITTLDGRVTVNEGDIASLQSDVATNTTGITNLDGRVTVNEGDIADLQTDVATNTTNITTLDGRVTTNEGDIANLQTDLATNTTNIANLDGRVTVNEGDIANIQTDVATNTTDIANVDARVTVNEQSIIDNSTAIQNLIDGSMGSTDLTVVNSRITQNENDIVDLDGRVTVNENDIANVQADVATNTSNIAGLDGRVSVNEGDIAALDTRVATNETDISNLDGRVTANEGDIVALDTRVATNETDISNLDGRVTVNEGDIASLDTRVTTAEGDIDTLEGRVTVNEGDIAALDTRQTDTEGDVANLDARVTVNEGDIAVLEGRVDNVPVAYVDDTDGVTRSPVPTGTVAFGAPGGSAVRVTNVADATLAAGSTDAVNGGQLFATNQAVAQNRTDIDANTASITSLTSSIQGSTVSAVQYSNPDNPTVSNGGTITNDVTLVGANASAPVALHNVADATSATDAVNLRQLQGGLGQVMADSIAYTDARFADLSFDLSQLENEAAAGTAAAMAMAAIPQTISASANMVGGAVSHYRGETAFGFGFSSAFNDGTAVVRINGTIDTRGRGGVAAGAGFSF
nr:YadA-like family protein [Qipengyuania sp. S6317L1]